MTRLIDEVHQGTLGRTTVGSGGLGHKPGLTLNPMPEGIYLRLPRDHSRTRMGNRVGCLFSGEGSQWSLAPFRP